MSDVRTETYATIDAMRSTAECIASVMIATDPVIAPAASFSAMRIVFDAIDSTAARVLTVPRGPVLAAARSGPAISPP